MHPGKCVQQHLNALVVHEPSHKQHTHRFRILLYLPQDGLAFHAPVRLHVNAVRDNAAFSRNWVRNGELVMCPSVAAMMQSARRRNFISNGL